MRALYSLIHSVFFSILILHSCNGQKNKETYLKNSSQEIDIIRFEPEKAIEYPFDSIFKLTRTIQLQFEHRNMYQAISSLCKVDSLFIANVYTNYIIFNDKGSLIREIGGVNGSFNSLKSLNFYYADKESILSICGSKWVKVGLNGSVLEKGSLLYEIYPDSFIPLDDSTWLFYRIRTSKNSDASRLWSTDSDFRIKKKYLSFQPGFPTGGMGFSECIFKTGNGIYITDRVVDTVYRFNVSAVEPIYLFDFGKYKYYREVVMRNLAFNEAASSFRIITSNAVLSKIIMNKKHYLVYHNRKTKKTMTIDRITDGPDILNSWILKGCDYHDNLLWSLSMGGDTLINQAAFKYGYADFLKLRKSPSFESKPIIAITTVK